jgi:hypothetical protein
MLKCYAQHITYVAIIKIRTCKKYRSKKIRAQSGLELQVEIIRGYTNYLYICVKNTRVDMERYTCVKLN